MNKERRKALDEVHSKLMTIVYELERAMSDLESIQGDEQEAFDNLPEGIQASERGEKIQETAETLDEQYYGLDNAKDSIEEAMGNLYDIIYDENGRMR